MAKFGKYNYKYNIIFIAGLPMSATTLVKNMLGLIPGYYTRYTPMSQHVAANQNISDSAFKYCPKKGFTLFKTHLSPLEENINIIRNHNVKKIIVTYRDLRDVVISEYHRRMNWPHEKNEPEYDDYRIVNFQTLNKEKALNYIISNNAEYYIKWIKGWFEISKRYKNFIHFCRFETLITSPEKELLKMLEFYEISISQKKINKIIQKTKGKKTMVKNMYQSALLPMAISSNFRSGKIGYWKKEFTESNKKLFKNFMGNFLIELGYEKDNNW